MRRFCAICTLTFVAATVAAGETPAGHGRLSWSLQDRGAPLAVPVEPPPFRGRLARQLTSPPEEANASPSRRREEVPAGFEELASGAAEIQGDVLVDVAVQDVAIGQALVSIDGDRVSFLNPDQVLKRLPVALKPRARTELEDVLRQPQAFAVPECWDGDTPLCTAAPWLVRLEDRLDQFLIVVRLNPESFERVPDADGAHLQATDSQWAVLSTLTGLYSDNPGRGDVAYSLTPILTASRGALRLTSRGTLTQARAYEADEANVAQDIGDYRYQAGIIEPRSRVLTTSGRFLGVAFGTQTDTRVDKVLLTGTELIVSVTQESFVEIFRDDRLLDVQRHSAGLVSLDTRRLPSGSYNVRVRVTPVAGGPSTEEIQFFAKAETLPPVSGPRFQLALGRPQDIDDTEMTALGEVDTRLGSRVVAGFASSVSSRENTLEARLRYLFEGGTLQVSSSRVSTGGYGWNVAVSAPLPHGSFAADYSRFPRPVEVFATTDGAGTAEIDGGVVVGGEGLAAEPEPVGFIDAAYRFSWRWSVLNSLSVSLSHVGQQFSNRTQRETGVSVSLPLLQLDRTFLRAGLDYRIRDEDDYVGINLSYSAARSGTSVNVRSDYRSTAETPAQRAQLQAELLHRIDLDDGTELQAGAGALVDEQTVNASIGASARGNRGLASVQLTGIVDEDGQSRQFTSGAFGTTVYSTLSGVGLAAPVLTDAILVVRVAGVDDEDFDVLINGQRRARVGAGGSAAVRLLPYERYEVSIAAVDSEGLDYDATSREVVLFPGNVQVGEWGVNRVMTVFGRLVDGRGEPLAHVRIDGTLDPVATDDQGFFQAQVKLPAHDLRVRAGTAGCEVPLPGPAPDEAFVALPDIVCD